SRKLLTHPFEVGDAAVLVVKTVVLLCLTGEEDHLRVERQTGRIYGEPGVRLLPLKTRASERTITIPPLACTILRWHQDVQRLARRQAEHEAKQLSADATIFFITTADRVA